MVQKIKNIGFILRDPNWHGGINYLRSLTSAISLLKKKILIFIYFGIRSELENFK